MKARIIDKKEPYSEIVKDNPTITEEQFEIFKAACVAEAAKEKSKYMKGLQERNMGCHHLGSRGYAGKRSIWAKEDAKRGVHDMLLLLLPSLSLSVAQLYMLHIINSSCDDACA